MVNGLRQRNLVTIFIILALNLCLKLEYKPWDRNQIDVLALQKICLHNTERMNH